MACVLTCGIWYDDVDVCFTRIKEEVGVAVEGGVFRRKRKRGESLVRAVEVSEDEGDEEEAARIRSELLQEQRSAHGGVRRMMRKTKRRAKGFSFHDLGMWDYAVGFGGDNV